MSSPDSTADTSPAAAGPPERRRNLWIWVSALLALVAVGVAIWALSVKSDLDSTQQDLAKTKQELDTTNEQLATTKKQLDTTKTELGTTQQEVEDLQSSAGGKQPKGRALTLVTVKALYDEFAKQLGATQEDLTATEQDLADAQKQAADAEKAAEAAKKDAASATDETEKAKAEAEQAKAESQAAQSKTQAAADCAKAYISAFGGLFEGESASDQADAVRKDLERITADCKAELSGG